MALAIEANMQSQEGRLQEALDLLFEAYASQLSQVLQGTVLMP